MMVAKRGLAGLEIESIDCDLKRCFNRLARYEKDKKKSAEWLSRAKNRTLAQIRRLVRKRRKLVSS
ncbi:MAG: hypothetical protein KatS3mg109_0064 [Pirellulaceae bacterium]|nr:MAG: hypothetical protein KatS3mg109_0064 [Pirellulaceae bacterium]